MAEEFNSEDLYRIFIVVPKDRGGGTENLSIVEMSDRQFRNWVTAKADMSGVRMIVPAGRIGLETRLNMLNHLSRNGVKIYKLA